MRKFRPLLLFFVLLAGACAGGSSRYGCPAESGHSCKSVSEVYAEAASGGGSATDLFRKTPGNGEGARGGETAGKRLAKGEVFRRGKDMRKRPGGKKASGEDKGTMPIYLPPPVIRLRIAPWQDARGVFHSEKYVYVLAGRGRWTIGGRTVPLGETEARYPGDIRLRGTGGAP